MSYDDFINIALDAAVLAGEKIMEVYNASEHIGFESKNDNSPLTIADKKSHDTIVSMLKKTGTHIISEESESIDYQIRKKWYQSWVLIL